MKKKILTLTAFAIVGMSGFNGTNADQQTLTQICKAKGSSGCNVFRTASSQYLSAAALCDQKGALNGGRATACEQLTQYLGGDRSACK